MTLSWQTKNGVTEPLVTVVMTVYNEARYVRDAVRSILGQTFSDLELIVVDDGSRDESAEIVASFGDPRIRLIRQTNTGLAGALNRGIAEARGRYIARQDADDVSDSDRLALQVAALEADPALVLLGTNALIVDEGGEEITKTELPESDAAIRSVLSDPRLRNAFVHGSVVFRRDAAAAAGFYRAELRYAQDYDLWLRLMERGTLANLHPAQYRWRLRREGVGATKYELQREYAAIAFESARRRRTGQPELPVVVQQRKHSRVQRILRSGRNVPQEAAYDMALAKLLLNAGERERARGRALAVVKARPLSLYAWLLIALSWMPTRFRRKTWEALRRLYRRVIWN